MIHRVVAVLMVMLVGMLLYSMFMEHRPEWVVYQEGYEHYLRLQEESLHRDLGLAPAKAVRQILSQDLELIDRCQTCHLGVDDPVFVDAPQPYTTHPSIPSHPFDRFGCVPCHQGQPWGTTVQAAHGHVAFWHEPILRRQFVEASCGRCHKETEVEGAPVLSRGRQLVRELGCEECHRINGLGGQTGPELTNVSKRQSIAYLRESIVRPKANDTNSVMPDFGLPSDDVNALIVAMMAMTSEAPYADLEPAVPVEQTVYHASYGGTDLSDGAQLVRSSGCVHCHRAGDVGVPYGGDLSGIGISKDADDIFETLTSATFDSMHPTLSNVAFRARQLELMSAYLATLKEETVVRVTPAVSQSASPAASRQPETIVRPASAAPANAVNSQVSVDVNPKDVETGKALYKTKNCKMCHRLGGSGGRIGPKLDDVGNRRAAEWLFFHFKDPQAISPGTKMPNNNFTDEEAHALTAYMLTLTK